MERNVYHSSPRGNITGSPECVQGLYSAQWDSVLVLYNLHKVLERCPAERYIKPVRIPGYLW